MGGKEFIYLDPPGTPRTATKSGAFDRGNGRREAHGVRGFLAFRQRQRERTVEDIAGSERIDGVHAKGRPRAQVAGFEPHHVTRPVGEGDKGTGALRNVAQCCRR